MDGAQCHEYPGGPTASRVTPSFVFRELELVGEVAELDRVEAHPARDAAVETRAGHAHRLAVPVARRRVRLYERDEGDVLCCDWRRTSVPDAPGLRRRGLRRI